MSHVMSIKFLSSHILYLERNMSLVLMLIYCVTFYICTELETVRLHAAIYYICNCFSSSRDQVFYVDCIVDSFK